MKFDINRKLARIISDVFVPPVNLVFLFLYLAFKFEPDSSSAFETIAIAVLFGFVFPVAFFVYLRKKKKVVDNDATIKEERTVPYLFGIFLSSLAFGLCVYFESSMISRFVWITYIVNTAILIIINKSWKISAHAIGAASPIGVIFTFNPQLALILLIPLAIISWSRIKLGVHTIPQVLAGSAFGLFATYFEIILLTKCFV